MISPATPPAADLPVPGQIVRVRGRHWTVTDVEFSSLPLNVKAGGADEGQTLVTLSSVEEDALGEGLRIVWEVEPGRAVRDSGTLPDLSDGHIDDPQTLAAFLDALRWGAITNADTTILQAPFRAGIAIEDFQLEPVSRALTMPRVNLLVADDVGLGKTIEAGLVVQEMLLRHRARRIMIVCPAPLMTKWQEEMDRRFGLRFAIVDSATVGQVRRERWGHANPFKVYPHTIVSMSWLRGARCQRLLSELLDESSPALPRAIDILIVDEAHHCAPSGRGQYAVDSQQTKAVARLGRHSEHRLFLSATPHNGYQESWTALLQMLDPQRFVRGVTPDPAALTEVLIRRMKSEINNEDGTPRYPERDVQEVQIDYPEHERAIHQTLKDYTAARRRRLAREENGAGAANDLVTLLLKKRLCSSPFAFTITLAKHRNSLEQAGDPMDVDEAWLNDARTRLLFDSFDDDDALDEEEAGATDTATRAGGRAVGGEEELLDELTNWAEQHGEEADAKALSLVGYLTSVCKPDGKWNNERVVVFTEYKDTARWLADLLDRQGFVAEGRLELIYGGMDKEARERITKDFQAPAELHPVRIILATDTASEGIDLQDQCYRLVSYDIPFNPNRLEQRAGRIDRYGQIRRPQIRHFVGSHWKDAPIGSADADLDFLGRVARKVQTMREDLGSVNPVLAAAVERRMLGISDPQFQIEKVQSKAVVQQALKVERNLREEAEKLRATLRTSRTSLHATPEDVYRVVSTGLKLGRQLPLESVHDERSGSNVYKVPALTGGWARTVTDLVDRDFGERPISFDPKVAASRKDLVLAHLNHPLVAMATRLLRAEVWGQGSIARATSLVVEEPTLTDQVLAAYCRLVLVGKDGSRLHEELFAAGGLVRGTAFSRLGVNDLNEALDTALAPGKHVHLTPQGHVDELARHWPKLSISLDNAVTARAKDREESLVKSLARRQSAETKRVTDLLDAFEKSLRGAIQEESQAYQPAFETFEPDERAQLIADRAAWQARLDALPQEREIELASIRERYESVQLLVFPAAVVHLVPARSHR